MKAKTRKNIGEVTAWIMVVLGGYRLISVLSLFTPYPLLAGISLPSLLVTFEIVVLSIIYVYAIRRNKLKAVRVVYRIWWVLGLIELSIVFLGILVFSILVADKWFGRFENLVVVLIILLCLGFPFGLITFLWWTGVRGLKQMVEPKDEQIQQLNRDGNC